MSESSQRHVRLSELARRVINAATLSATAWGHPLVGLGHLLLALAGEGRSLSSALLRDGGLDSERLRAALDTADFHPSDAPLFAGLSDALEAAFVHAERLGNHYTGTEHLLLALTTTPEGALLLELYGAEIAPIRRRLIAHLGGG